MTQIAENELVVAEQEIFAAWQKYQAIERHGIEFGSVCYFWREKFKVKGFRGNAKGKGICAILHKCKIPRRTAYFWIERYEEFIGLRKPENDSDESDNVHFSSDSAEWYTPPEIVERAIAALGSIDIDPCCNPGEPAVPAKTVYREADNGLDHPWNGRVYMNPPYGDVIKHWVEKLVTEYAHGVTKEAIALVPARVDTDWFDLFHEFAACFIHGRLKFSGCENSAPFPSAIIYLGPNLEAFYSAFEGVGRIRVPREWLRGEGQSA